jgi:hypothetical protein
MDFFDTLDPLLRTLWYIAIPTSIIFIIQSIMTFIGGDASDSTEFHTDTEGYSPETSGGDNSHFFSLRNLINFLLGFSWAGIGFYNSIENRFLLIFIAFNVGFIFVVMFFYIIKQLLRLGEDNTFNIQNTLSKTADVYLTIPAKGNGKGKIHISVNGSFHELDAITENDRIETGSIVKIIKITADNIVVVEKLTS